MIFLFKWIGHNPSTSAGVESAPTGSYYFAQQVITNACATLALLNAVMNLEGKEIGEELNNLQSFSEGLDSESKGWTISNSEKIRSGELFWAYARKGGRRKGKLISFFG